MFSENRVQIDASVQLEFCSQEKLDTQTNCSENITPPRFRRQETDNIDNNQMYQNYTI